MKQTITLLLAGAITIFAQAPLPLAERIGHTDPSKRGSGRSHDSLGDMKCQTLLGRGSVPFLNFMHRCEMTTPHGGVGAHFHNTGEEMFVVFDGEAEFTIDGRTSTLKGHVVGAPVRMGHSHAILNTTDKPVEFMNIQVGAVDGRASDAFNLSDARLGAPKDAIPTFMTMRLETTSPAAPARRPQGGDSGAAPANGGRGRGGRGGGGGNQNAAMGALQEMQDYHGGKGTVRYRRALYPAIFLTNWAYVDHLIIAPGAIDGLHRHPHVGEIYYVLNGDGQVKVNAETSAIRKGDGIPVKPDEAHSITNTGAQDLELMIVGISTAKDIVDTVEVK